MFLRLSSKTCAWLTIVTCCMTNTLCHTKQLCLFYVTIYHILHLSMIHIFIVKVSSPYLQIITNLDFVLLEYLLIYTRILLARIFKLFIWVDSFPHKNNFLIDQFGSIYCNLYQKS